MALLPNHLESFFWWINERHSIYLKKKAGKPRPWTDDDTLNTFKFTNVFRELDRTTVWMREHYTGPNHTAPAGDIIFNCCMFRMFGTMEFAESVGWIKQWDPKEVKSLARARLDRGMKVFTGAYIITNQGMKLPKEQVVVDYFLNPIWEDREHLGKVFVEENSLGHAHKILGKYPGWGGGGFMAYEVITDLNHTLMPLAKDRMLWANAGPGAKRGLNRLHGRRIDIAPSKHGWNAEMGELLDHAPARLGKHVPIDQFDMRSVEHSLCEWDKYQRVELGQGKPRSLYKETK